MTLLAALTRLRTNNLKGLSATLTIVARIRWIDETLTVLHREMAAAMNPDDPRQSANFRNH
jgi:hypothetical protein